MWRVIVRIGYFNDGSSLLRNRIALLLEQLGLLNTDTGTWEAITATPADVANQLGAALTELARAQGAGGGVLEHLWVYVDRVVLP